MHRDTCIQALHVPVMYRKGCWAAMVTLQWLKVVSNIQLKTIKIWVWFQEKHKPHPLLLQYRNPMNVFKKKLLTCTCTYT